MKQQTRHLVRLEAAGLAQRQEADTCMINETRAHGLSGPTVGCEEAVVGWLRASCSGAADGGRCAIPPVLRPREGGLEREGGLGCWRGAR